MTRLVAIGGWGGAGKTRGIERDGEAMRWKWETVWMPEEEEYVRTQDPIGRADVVIDGSDSQFYEQST
ncbi:MAG: hypothetical protein M3Z28_08880 [Candidatus Dormibacteraeota bacterium]|nr:hypothetical protein [Candidatus Dormibacteraeota bacterium]